MDVQYSTQGQYLGIVRAYLLVQFGHEVKY